MIKIKNARIIEDKAYADLDVISACCCKTIHVMADFNRQDGLFTNIININTFTQIYTGLWENLINEWKKLYETKTS